tara:strand:+ start:211 stop:366 length:156 start_codon:yes stop_codon:yes gene_type:complete
LARVESLFQARIASFLSYLQNKIGDLDLDDPMEINEEIRMEDDMDEVDNAW